MASALTGKFDVVAEFSIQAVNRVLAAQHQGETYLHSIPADVPAEGLPWVRIDDAETGVHGLAQIQVSTPTITLPAGENASRITIHYQLMAHIQADSESAAVPEFVHGEIQVTVDVAQEPGEGGDLLIEVGLGAEDLEVTFTPDPGAPLTDEETRQVNQIIRSFLMTGFDPVSSVVDLPGRGAFKTMPDDERPAVALLLNLTDKEPEADHPDTVTEVFLDEEDDFAIAIGRDFLKCELRRIILDVLSRKFTAQATTWFGTATYSVSLYLDVMTVELTDGQIELTVNGNAKTDPWWAPDFDFEVDQAFSLSVKEENIILNAVGDPDITVKLHGVDVFGVIEDQVRDKLREQVLDRRDQMLDLANDLIDDMLTAQPEHLESGLFGDSLDGLRISRLSVEYTSAPIQEEGVVLHGTLDTGPWQDVVATFETRSTWPSETIVLLIRVGLIYQDDLEQGVLSQEFREILQRLQGFPLSRHEVITTEEEGGQWRIDDQGRTYTVVREGDTLGIYGIDIWKIDYECNAFNSWIPGGTIQRYWWIYGSDEVISWDLSEEHKFKIKRTEDMLRVDVRGLNPLHPFRLCLEVSGIQGSPPREVSGWVCSGLAPRPPAVQDAEGGGLFVEVPDSEGGVVAHIDPFWLELPPKLRPGGHRPRRSGRANLLVHFPGSKSTQTWSVLCDALVRRSRKDAAVFLVAVVPPGLVVEPLKLKANIAWARTEDAEQGWAKAFRVTAMPATFVVNPQGKTVWQHVGRLDADAFAAALDEHLVASVPLRWQQLGLKVRVGQLAPDFIFEYLGGRQIALRALRRRPVLLNFWKSWSAPCLAELRHLQKLHDRFAREGWVIQAINDGEDPQRAREVFKENGFTFNLVADADRHIAQLFGVSCWPTTVSINEEGFVRRIQFGVTPGKGGISLQRLQPPQQ